MMKEDTEHGPNERWRETESDLDELIDVSNA